MSVSVELDETEITLIIEALGTHESRLESMPEILTYIKEMAAEHKDDADLPEGMKKLFTKAEKENPEELQQKAEVVSEDITIIKGKMYKARRKATISDMADVLRNG